MLHEYDEECYEAVMDMFDWLPISAVINGEYLALHGGISNRFKSFADVEAIQRNEEPPYDCLMNDLLWADPISDEEDALEISEESSSE